jgi:leucine-rich repeat kinase 1/leucine-rich repeat kinase 2
MQDDASLHKFCHNGKLDKIKSYIEAIESNELLQDRLNNRRGVFGYTPLHEAVSGNKAKVVPYLVGQGANVNARANSGYTPLHLAASAGHIDCVKILLESQADISLKDDYGKTPKQTAGLSSKSNIVRLLRSEGKCNRWIIPLVTMCSWGIL